MRETQEKLADVRAMLALYREYDNEYGWLQWLKMYIQALDDYIEDTEPKRREKSS